MKYLKTLALMLAAASLVVACNDDDMVPGNPVMDVTGDLGSAFFGDTLRFNIKASDAQVPLSTIHAEIYYGSEKVSEQVIRTKVSGAEYPVAVYVPYMANIPDGDATLRLTLQNINFTTTEQNYSVSVSHKLYPNLTFVTDDGDEYVMTRESAYTYSVTDNFPQQVKGKIYTPENDFGDRVVFGYESGEIKVDGMNSIPFSYAKAGNYTISFDTYTFEGAPFISPTINGENTETLDDDSSFVDLNLAKGALLEFDGFPDFENWWLNPDFIQKNADGTYSFMAYDGTYRFIADMKLKYFKVVKLVGSEPATLSQDGTGNVWIIGDGMGYPSTSNQPAWEPSKAIPMAPTSDRTYQVTVVGGINININDINFKFFGQAAWADQIPNGIELTGSMLTSESDIIGVGTGENGHDNGNLFLKDGVTLEANGIYVITLDLTGGVNNAVLRTDFNGEQQFEEQAIYVNGKKMDTFDNSTYSIAMQLNQGEAVEITQFADVNELYFDPDYFAVSGNDIQFQPVSGYYNIVLDKGLMTFMAQPLNADGSKPEIQSDGTGAIYMNGWGVGNPSQDFQFDWNADKFYALAQVEPGVYQFTGVAGPETGSVYGNRFRYDYLNFNLYGSVSWNPTFGYASFTPLGNTDSLLAAASDGNFNLAAGVSLEEGATYRLTVDMKAMTVNLVKL